MSGIVNCSMRVGDFTSHANPRNTNCGMIKCSMGWGDLISYLNLERIPHSCMANCYGRVGDFVCFIHFVTPTAHKT